ncbi:hypothetical protein [Kitasatospora sp. GAS204B]|uniref:hypothetical protein n=1 Tax=unclassified Kitasatospora TaxID=2633591 RepID=UPI002472E8FE|nr:hypothetical protein [Kitasatospora sp. GAS204B]MDH6117962.1 hypothetical protein [Kitasatospora sp. GAS204B]
MSETIGSPVGGTPLTGLTSAPEESGRATRPGPGGMAAAHVGRLQRGGEMVQEAYSFACLNCGYGWEQAYDIEHHQAKDGHTVVQYYANGVRVPSPLLQPTCPGCGGHTVRIMQPGRIRTAESLWHHSPGFAAHAEPADPPQPQELRTREHWYQLWLPKP